jgi:hypothetical protein
MSNSRGGSRTNSPEIERKDQDQDLDIQEIKEIKERSFNVIVEDEYPEIKNQVLDREKLDIERLDIERLDIERIDEDVIELDTKDPNHFTPVQRAAQLVMGYVPAFLPYFVVQEALAQLPPVQGPLGREGAKVSGFAINAAIGDLLTGLVSKEDPLSGLRGKDFAINVIPKVVALGAVMIGGYFLQELIIGPITIDLTGSQNEHLKELGQVLADPITGGIIKNTGLLLTFRGLEQFMLAPYRCLTRPQPEQAYKNPEETTGQVIGKVAQFCAGYFLEGLAGFMATETALFMLRYYGENVIAANPNYQGLILAGSTIAIHGANWFAFTPNPVTELIPVEWQRPLHTQDENETDSRKGTAMFMRGLVQTTIAVGIYTFNAIGWVAAKDDSLGGRAKRFGYALSIPLVADLVIEELGPRISNGISQVAPVIAESASNAKAFVSAKISNAWSTLWGSRAPAGGYQPVPTEVNALDQPSDIEQIGSSDEASYRLAMS